MVRYCNHGTAMFMYSVHVHWGCCHGYHRLALMSASECTTCLVMYWYMCSVYMSVVQWTIVRRGSYLSIPCSAGDPMKSVCLGQEGGGDLSQRSVTPRQRDARVNLDSLHGIYQIRVCLEQAEAVCCFSLSLGILWCAPSQPPPPRGY